MLHLCIVDVCHQLQQILLLQSGYIKTEKANNTKCPNTRKQMLNMPISTRCELNPVFPPICIAAYFISVWLVWGGYSWKGLWNSWNKGRGSRGVYIFSIITPNCRTGQRGNRFKTFNTFESVGEGYEEKNIPRLKTQHIVRLWTKHILKLWIQHIL